MNKPVVSVVMIVCNVERFLAEAIESILGQTFRDFEFLIVDFGSTDKSKSIVSSFAEKDQRNCGLAEARNAGCFLAQGRYIAIIDADDISLPERLMWQVEFMDKHPEVGLLSGTTEWIDSEGRSLFVNDDASRGNAIRAGRTFRWEFSQTTFLIRSDAFAEVGGYRAAFLQAEDYDLVLRISEHFQCANLKQVVAKFRVHIDQTSIAKHRQQTLCTLAAELSSSARKAGKPDPMNSVEEITPAQLARLGVSDAMLQTALASRCRDWVRNLCLAGEYSVALKEAVEFLHSSDLQFAGRRPIADLWLAAAWIHWRQRNFCDSLLAFARGLIVRPVVMGRLLKQMLERFELLRR
jgi:cellulose synthase/poly-beta-1,6-N-acetylglucosamine synthase-like glycosyltransferase